MSSDQAQPPLRPLGIPVVFMLPKAWELVRPSLDRRGIAYTTELVKFATDEVRVIFASHEDMQRAVEAHSVTGTKSARR